MFYKKNGKNIYFFLYKNNRYLFHYSLLYLTVSNSFDPISALDSGYSIFYPDPSTTTFQPKVYSTPTSTSPGSQAQNTFTTPSFDPPSFSSIITPDLNCIFYD